MKFLELGRRYKGIGSSGMTDGCLVEGILTEADDPFWYLILTRDDGMPCAVNPETIEEVDEDL